MKDEIKAAVDFLMRLINRNQMLNGVQAERFSLKLSEILVNRFTNHWHTDSPCKGQAFRCIRINECVPVDPILSLAAKESGIDFHSLDLPSELTLWVDPSEVSCRFGETKSEYCILATLKDGKLDNRVCSLDINGLVRQHYLKKEEDLNKLKDWIERSSSPSVYPSPIDMSLQYLPSGEVHNASTPNGRWKPSTQRRNVMHDLADRSPSRNRSPVMLSSGSGVFNGMKTGGSHPGTPPKYHWPANGSKTATPTKA